MLLRLKAFRVPVLWRDRVLPTITPRMTAADSLQGQPSATARAVSLNGLNRVGRAGGIEAALAQRSEQEQLGRREDPAIHPNPEYQDVLCKIHFPLNRSQQSRFPQACQKILLDVHQSFARNGLPGNQYQINRMYQLVLMQPKALAHEAPRPVADHGTADPAGSNDPQARMSIGTELKPVRNQTTICQSRPFLAESREIASLFNSCGTTEPEPGWGGIGHTPGRVRRLDYTGVRRLRPTRRRLRKIALPLLLELRFKNPCCRLRRIFDG